MKVNSFSLFLPDNKYIMALLQYICMKKRCVCIFAHPDDEAFGPSGTIHLLTKDYDVYEICVTNGDAGENSHPDAGKGMDLGKQRQSELRASAKTLGIQKVFFLNYPDGELSNNKYHEIAADIRNIIDDIKPELILTNEHRGVSGHLDHIAVAMIASYLFKQLSYIKKIMFSCLRYDQRPKERDDYFIYFPEGLKDNQIDESYDVKPVLEIKRKAMSAHISQTHDMVGAIKNIRLTEYFYTWSK